jgi:uncharacterized membrane protein YphA (DoxX/SURF4 family)
MDHIKKKLCLLTGLTRLIYELIWHGIKGPLRRETTATTLGEIVVSILYPVISSSELVFTILLVSLWNVDCYQVPF